MNNPRFAAIQAQLRPSPGAEEALRRRMAETAPRRRQWLPYAAAAACAALLLCAIPLGRGLTAPPLHSYVLAGPGTAGQNTSGALGNTAAPAGGTPEDAPVDVPPVPDPDPGRPDRPYEAEGTAAYQSLLAHFGGGLDPVYPEWYGGAYLDEEGRLVVLTVEGLAPSLPEALENSGAVVLEDRARYSLAHLRDLQGRASEAMMELGILAGCGVDEEANRVYLAIREASREALIALARLDPEDEAIYVEVTPYPDAAMEDAPPADAVSRRHDIESPELYFGDPGAPVTDEDGAIAEEPPGEPLGPN